MARDDGSRGEKGRLRACKLLHIFSIIFLKFPVRSRDLPFLSPHQTSRWLVRQGEITLRDRLDTSHSFCTFPPMGCHVGHHLWSFNISRDHSLGFNGVGEMRSACTLQNACLYRIAKTQKQADLK